MCQRNVWLSRPTLGSCSQRETPAARAVAASSRSGLPLLYGLTLGLGFGFGLG